MSFYNGILNHDDIHGSGQIGLRGLPGVGFNLDSNNDYDMQNKKLVNVKNGVNGSDAVTKSQLDTKTSLLDGARTHGYIVNNKAVIYSQSGAVHAKSFYLQDQNEDEVRILTDNQDFDNVHLFVPNLKNFDGFGGRKRSEIMVTSVDQIISGNKFFQNIKAPNPTEDGDVANKNYVDFEITKQNVLIDNEFVKKSGSLMTGDLILPHYNYPVQGNTNKAISYETQREIFISRKETFPMETSLDMNNNFLVNVKDPVNADHGTNKKYVDDEIKKIPQGGGSSVDTTPFLKIDGTRAMTGNLDMSDNSIQKVSVPLNADDAATKNYVDEALLKSHLTSSYIENSFKYAADQDESSSERNIIVNGILFYDQLPHANKKAYSIDLVYTAGTQNYDSKIGINLYPLPIGKYTMIMEYYFPENINITLLAEASTAIINKQQMTDFPNYKKLWVQLNQQTKDTPDYIYFTIRGSGTTSTNPEGYLVFYGVKEWIDSVPPGIYDHAMKTGMFEYDDAGDMKMNTNLDMDKHRIMNIPQPTNPTDLLMKQSVNIFDVSLYGTIDRQNDLTSQGVTIGFDSVYIVKITLINKDKYRGNTDRIIISYKNQNGILSRLNYPFRFPPSSQITVIIINRLFLGEVIRLMTQTAIQIPFVLTYRSLHI